MISAVLISIVIVLSQAREQVGEKVALLLITAVDFP